MELLTLYRQVAKEIQKIDTQEIWQGFRPCRFALYDDKFCCFDGEMIEKTSEFLANTAIEYQNEWIAIWNVQEELDPRILASKIVHEMFHVFQRVNRESHFPNELRALYDYTYSNENLSLKLRENQLLVSAVRGEATLSEILSIRKYRAEHFPKEFSYEAKVEQIEGTATYVELMALQQLSPQSFENRLSQMCDTIVQPQQLLPVRIISYDIGAILLYVLKTNGIPFQTAFADQTFAECLLNGCKAGKPHVDMEMEKYIDAYFANVKRAIASAKSNGCIVFEGETHILGVNVYNAVYLDGYILSNYFVMYGDEAAPTIEYGDFLIETPQEGIATKIYRLK